MAIGYQRQSSANIVDGNIIYASFLNAEFNKLESAFDSVSGHSHDGTTGGGAPVAISDTTGTLSVTRGGTGQTTVAGVQTSLGVVVGTDVQAWDANLDDLAALAHTDGSVIISNGTNWVVESGATARSSLGLTIDTDIVGRSTFDTHVATFSAHATNNSNPHNVTAAQVGSPTTAAFTSHTTNTSNPHSTTASQVGLGNVLNKPQLAKDGSETPTGDFDWAGNGLKSAKFWDVREVVHDLGDISGAITLPFGQGGIVTANLIGNVTSINFTGEVSGVNQAMILRLSNGASFTWPSAPSGIKTPSGLSITQLVLSSASTTFDEFLLQSIPDNSAVLWANGPADYQAAS